MNPCGLERLARQRTDDIRKAAERRQAFAVPRDRTRSIRNRAGWALVHVGLSLISTSPRIAPYPAQGRRGHATSW